MPNESCYPVDPIDRRVIIVGASLAGLTLALACARQGVPTYVLERVREGFRSGGALGVDRSLLLRTVGADLNAAEDETPFPVLTKYRKAASWNAVHGWLCAQVSRCAMITMVSGNGVLKLRQTLASVTAITTTGECIEAGIIVGADGYQSVVRRAVDPLHPTASYAGYLLWRGLVAEEALSSRLKLPESNAGIALVTTTGYRLVAYPVAGAGGSLEPGKRAISFAWYDPFRNDLLRASGCLSRSGQVMASLPAGEVPAATIGELRSLAETIWPDPWRAVICDALERREIFATPVAEYSPRRLCNGRLAIVGDAAHVVSPVTGQGFVTTIHDARLLAHHLGLAFGQLNPNLPGALRSYSAARLASAQELARASAVWTRSYLHDNQKLPAAVGGKKSVK